MQALRKNAMTHKDNEGNEYIKFKELLEMSKPKKVVSKDLGELNRLVTKIQAIWRGHVQRTRYLKMQKSDLKNLGQQFGRVTRGVKFDGEE